MLIVVIGAPTMKYVIYTLLMQIQQSSRTPQSNFNADVPIKMNFVIKQRHVERSVGRVLINKDSMETLVAKDIQLNEVFVAT